MNQRRALLIQTLVEAIIPVAGYFFWKWDVTFILLFYLLDWLLFLSLTFAKARKRLSYSGLETEKRIAFSRITAGLLTCMATCVILYFTIPQLVPGLDWIERMVAFLTYSDMGIQQGFVLIPLIALNGYLLYKQQFLMPARYRTQTMEVIVRPALVQGVILTGAALLCWGLSALVSYPTEVIIALAVVGTSTYRLKARR